MIVNADDFGWSESVTMAIKETFHNGWINQTTLMVTMPYADQAVEIAKKDGFADKVGLHFNIVDGYPLSEKVKKTPAFCNPDGTFNNFTGHQKLFWNGLSKADRDALRDEIEAQVEKYLSYGLPLMHCDGHQHCHWRWCILRELLPILKKYGFKSVRRPHNLSVLNFNFRHPALRWRIFSRLQTSAIRRAGFSVTSLFGDYEQYLAVRETVQGMKSFELMLHPDYDENGKMVNKYCSHVLENMAVVGELSKTLIGM